MSNAFSPTFKPAATPAPTPAVTPPNAFAPAAPAPVPVKPTLTQVAGPPEPTFQRLGSQAPMSIPEFNQRLEQLTQSAIQQAGVTLKPDAALHAVLTPGSVAAPPAPTSPVTAKSGKLDTSYVGLTPTLIQHPALTDQQFFTQFAQAAGTPDGYRAFLQQNGSRLAELQKDPLWGLKVTAVVNGVTSRFPNAGSQTSEAGLLPTHGLADLAQAVGHTAAAAGVDLAQTTANVTVGVYDLFKTEYLADKWFAEHPEYIAHPLRGGNPYVARERTIEVAMAKQTEDQLRHPENHPISAALDILGIAAPVFGAAGRIAAAGEAFGEAEDVGVAGKVAAAARAATSSFSPATYTVAKGGYAEQLPLFRNPFTAWLQVNAPVMGLDARMARLESRFAEQSFTAQASWVPRPISWAQDQLSIERKIGRAGDARRRVEYSAAMAPKHALDEAVGAAWANSEILAKVPPKLLRGLSLGEMKAIQVMSWDAEDPLAAEREANIRDAQLFPDTAPAHQRQLGYLDLAEKALKDPSPRLLRALDEAAKVSAENQRLRIEKLGLAPERAEARIAKGGSILRGEETTGKRVSEKSFYVPVHPTDVARAAKPGSSAGFVRSSVGTYGMGPGASLPELSHEFTGATIREGNYRIDAPNLLGESYAKTVKAVSVKNDYDKAWDAGTEKRLSEWDIAVRDIRTIPPELRQALSSFDNGFVTTDDLESLPKDIRTLIQELYIDPKDVTPELEPHVRWIDQRVLGQSARPPLQGVRGLEPLNNLLRPLIFYIYPKYILNKLNNDAMLIFDQGIWNAGVNMAKSMRADELYGKENADVMRSVVGAGRQASYVTTRSGHVNQALAHFWNRWADRDERVASFIHYADLKGYRTPEEMQALLRDPANHSDFLDVSQRGKKALVEYDSMSTVEKAYIRQFLFVWPWVHGSTVWSFRAVFEHPARAAILAAISNQGAAENDPWLKQAPLWMKRVGYIPVAWEGKNPVVIDASQLNTWSTLSQLENVVQAGVEGDPYASASDLLGPVGAFAIHGFTGRNSQGTAYKGSQWWGAAKDALQIVPLLAAFNRQARIAKAAGKTLPPIKITDRASLEARLNAALHQTVLTPDFLDGYGNLLAGGFSPSTVNLDAAAARYWRDATQAQRNAREVDLLNRALTIQGEYLGRPVPKNVRAAVSQAALLTQSYATYKKETGRTPTLKERGMLTIQLLAKRGAIPAAEAAELQAKLKPIDIRGSITAFTAAVLTKYGHLGEFHEWNRDVAQTAAITPDYLNQAAAQLHADGVSPQKRYQVKKDALHAYALGYSKYLDAYRAMVDKKVPDKNGILVKANTAAELRVFEDEHDHPVNGLPSYVALKWASAKPAAQQKAIVRATIGTWSSLNGFEKRLLGKPVADGVTEAWNAYATLVKEEEAREPVGHQTLAANQRVFLVKYVDQHYGLKGAFYKDYLFSKQRLYQRLPYLRLIKDSPNRSDWQQLLERANEVEAQAASGAATQSAVDAQWKDYAAQLEAYYRSDNPAFYAELTRFLTENKNFLADLIH